LNPAHPHALRGIGLMVLAVSTFTCLDTTSKYLAQHYPVPGIVFVRYIVQMLLMVVVLAPRMGMDLLRTANLRLQIVRGVLAEAASIAFMAPIIVAVLAGPLLKEQVGARTWIALAGGFVGVLLIIRPGGDVFTWVAFLPLFSALGMALYQMLTSKLAGRDAPLVTLFYPALIGTALVPLVAPTQLVLPESLAHCGLFLLIGVLGGLGHFLLIRAHQYAPSSILSPFMYAQLVTALFLGWLVFGDLPDGLAFVGMATVAASGLLLILAHRSNSVRRT
jgi:drug/metabolite transporter (DMT)-like permease